MAKSIPVPYVMPGRHKFTRHVFIIFFVVLAAAAVLFLPSQRKFTIIEEKTGRLLYFEDIKPGDNFIVRYVHSVNKSPVDDIFTVDEDFGFTLKKTIFHSFGAGVPYETEPGQILNIYSDRMELENINRKLEHYLLFVGTIADHTYIRGNVQLHLDKLVKPQTSVHFSVRKLSPFFLYTHKRGVI